MPNAASKKVMVKETLCGYCEQLQANCCQNKGGTLKNITQQAALTESVTLGSTNFFLLSEAAGVSSLSDTGHSIEKVARNSLIDKKEETPLSVLSQINTLINYTQLPLTFPHD